MRWGEEGLDRGSQCGGAVRVLEKPEEFPDGLNVQSDESRTVKDGSGVPGEKLEGQSRHLLKWEERQRRREWWWGGGHGKGRGAPEGRAEMEPGQAPRVCSTSKERRRAHSRVGEPAIRGKV